MAFKRRRFSSKKQRDFVYGLRSGLEERIQASLLEQKIPFTYESLKIPFVQPEKKRTYTPDFVLTNGIIIETKGRLTTEDMHKLIWVKEQHPEYDIRLLFQNANTKVRKGSKTTYADWCNKHGFIYADKEIPASWLT